MASSFNKLKVKQPLNVNMSVGKSVSENYHIDFFLSCDRFYFPPCCQLSVLEDLWPGTEEAKCFLQQHRPRGHSGGGAWQHVQTAPQTQSPGDLRPAALPEEWTAAVVSRSMGRGRIKVTLTLFPSVFSIWRRSLTQSFESQKLLKLFIFLLHASPILNSHTSLVIILCHSLKVSQKYPSTRIHQNLLRGACQVQRRSETEEQSPKCNNFNPIGNSRSYRKRQVNPGNQTGKEQKRNPQTKNKN